MLVLSRKKDESIVFDGPAVIRIRAIAGNRVRLEIKAPETTRVLRGELDGADQPMEAKKDAGV